jgi:bifunctional N-acetylglucosamine-1-phosphate-uridyltransferase/glucosamine-1-phosphate-acetyltransferase GlmU-like protein
MGATSIGKGCTIREYTTLENAITGDNVTILPHCLISNTHIPSHHMVGPFAQINETEETIIMPQKNTTTESLSFIGTTKTNNTSHHQNTP